MIAFLALLKLVPLKVWLLLAALLAAILGLWYFSHVRYEAGYNAAAVSYQQASDAALRKAQAAQAAESARLSAINSQTVSDYDAKLKAVAVSNAALSGLLRQYSAKLRHYPLPGLPTTPSGTAPSPQGASSADPVADSAASAIAACANDSAQLEALQKWVSSTLH